VQNKISDFVSDEQTKNKLSDSMVGLTNEFIRCLFLRIWRMNLLSYFLKLFQKFSQAFIFLWLQRNKKRRRKHKKMSCHLMMIHIALKLKTSKMLHLLKVKFAKSAIEELIKIDDRRWAKTLLGMNSKIK
jgi:hypothetical protein